MRPSGRRFRLPADPLRVGPASRSSSPDVVAAHWFTAPSSSSQRPRGLPPSVRSWTQASATTPTGLGCPLRVRASPPIRGTEVPGCPSWSSAPLQRHGRQGPLHPGLPHPARSALGVSHPPDGLLLCHCATSRAAAIHGVSDPASVVRHGLPRLATRRAVRTRCDPASHSEEHEVERFEPKCPSPLLPRSVVPEGAPNLPERGSPRKILRP